MRNYSLRGAFALCSLTFAGLTMTGAAQAAMLHTGSVNQKINVTITAGALPVTPESGEILAGNFVGSTLDNAPLPFVYCVDLSRNININNGPYTTNINMNGPGQIFGVAVPNAGKVTYLLDHYGLTATTADQTTALQAAIWKTMYGSQFTLNGPGAGTDSGVLTAYNTYLTNVGSDPVSNLKWLSPFNSDGSSAQGLVTSNVPEPGSVAFLTAGGLTGFGLLLRRRARK